jgi:hypothetical protein
MTPICETRFEPSQADRLRGEPGPRVQLTLLLICLAVLISLPLLVLLH